MLEKKQFSNKLVQTELTSNMFITLDEYESSLRDSMDLLRKEILLQNKINTVEKPGVRETRRKTLKSVDIPKVKEGKGLRFTGIPAI